MTNTTTKPTESFADLFAESLAKQEMKQGEVIPAEVVRVDYNYVVVNAGLKSESFIPIEEFKNDRGEVDVKGWRFRFRCYRKPRKTDMATQSCPAIRPSAWLPG